MKESFFSYRVSVFKLQVPPTSVTLPVVKKERSECILACDVSRTLHPYITTLDRKANGGHAKKDETCVNIQKHDVLRKPQP